MKFAIIAGQTRHMTIRILVAALLVLLAIIRATGAAENWPQWRGPSGDSVCTETNLPVSWSETEHVVWKCTLP